jgi:asparagine synthase (glutamine-hydrolysing)
MCGIAGNIDRSGNADRGNAPQILSRLEHRGPDDYGFLRYGRSRVEVGRDWSPPHIESEVILLHRRLSILDLAKTGWQPMSTTDGRYHVVFNGEIYNYIELRQELESLGHSFRSQSDTEVLLAAYARWGTDALRRFIGMFAFAVLDTVSRVVLLARDYFGIKPLYYSADRDGFTFASEIKALLEFGTATREVDRERVLLYLRHGACKFGSATMFANVHQLPPAHYLLISLDRDFRSDPVCYWKPETATNHDISFDEAASHVRDLFIKNIRLHLRSDVPVGAALSGGIDSSAITMAMREVDSRLQLHTFSYIAEDESISEEKWVDIIGTAASAEVHKTRPDADSLVTDLNELMYAQDEPFGGTSMYAQYCVFRSARESGVKVMLDGQGADEILGGYRYYLGARLASLLRQGEWGRAADFLIRCSHLPNTGKIWLMLIAGEHLLPADMHLPMRKLVGKDPNPPWLKQAWFHEDTHRSVRGYGPGSELLKERLLRTLTESSLPNLLRYEDRNSMAFSIESRVPFLTPEFVNFILSLPEDYIVGRDGTSKAVFRRAMRGIVPDCILDRRDKVGFATPEQTWLLRLQEWVGRVLSCDAADSIPFLDMKIIRGEWDAVRQGRKPFDLHVWRWVNLIQWTQQFGIQYDG